MGIPVARMMAGAACVLAITAGTAAADDSRSGRTKWWQSERFRQELGLSADQSARIEEVFQATLPGLMAAKAELDRVEGVLSNLVADATVDEGRIGQQIDQVEKARSELSKLRTLMLFRMHRILTPEQRVKLKALHEQEKHDHSTESDDRRWPRTEGHSGMANH
jgi:Spy/CpxP family protein refolding chaperone